MPRTEVITVAMNFRTFATLVQFTFTIVKSSLSLNSFNCSFLWRRERTKETFPQPRPSLEGRMQTESRRSRRLSVGFGIAGHAMVVYSAGAMRKMKEGDAQIAFKAVIWTLFLRLGQTG